MSVDHSLSVALDERARDVLRRRATTLANASGQEVAAVLTLERPEQVSLLLRFIDERFAVPLTVIREAISLRSVVVVPGAPAHVVGLTRIRGAVTALVDVRRFWSSDTRGHADADLAVIVEHRGVDFGIVCTQIEGLREFQPDEVKPPPSNLDKRQAACLIGVADRRTLLVDIPRLVAQPGFLVRQGREEEQP